jgi:Na+/H+-dicarboxylate symporter
LLSGARHNNNLLIAILIGAVAGITCGWFFGEAMKSLEWLGTLFLNALKMTIIPLIAAAVISGVASLGDFRKLGKLGGFTIVYYATTTALAVLTGLILVNIIEPGSSYTSLQSDFTENIQIQQSVGFVEIILSLVSPNLIAAASETQLLPIIIFCLIFGAALTTTGTMGQPVIQFFNSLNEVMMQIVLWVMYFAPIGIFAMIAARLGQAGGGDAFLQEISLVGKYIFTVILGLLIHFCVLLVLLHLFTRRSFDYVMQMMRALLTAFGTASSSATLPLTMECALDAGVDKRSIKFVLPLGATINMDGTALYEAVAVMFIAQAYAISMGFTEQVIIFITATLAAIGAAGIPQAGLITMVIVLTAVNLPLEGIGMLLAVDWFLDRIRTLINVWGDSTGAAILEKVLKQ